MKSHLRVKVFSMTAEMTYIRRQEEKWKNKARYARIRQRVLSVQSKPAEAEKAATSTKYAEDNFWSLRGHRDLMKKEARTTHLAYGCMKGIPYSQMEQLCYGVFKGYGIKEPDWGKIELMVHRFSLDEPSPQDYLQRFAQWITEAKVWYEGNEQRIRAATEERTRLRLARQNDPEYQALRAARNALAEGLGRAAAAS